MHPIRLAFFSHVCADPESVWESTRTFRAVNREMFPLLRMTCPAEFQDTPYEDYPLGKTPFTSWILLLGVLPMEASKVRLIRVESNKGFQEHSEMLLAPDWIHHRTLEPAGTGCRITDVLEITPRMRWIRPLLSAFVKLVFWNRHRRLRKLFPVRGGVG